MPVALSTVCPSYYYADGKVAEVVILWVLWFSCFHHHPIYYVLSHIWTSSMVICIVQFHSVWLPTYYDVLFWVAACGHHFLWLLFCLYWHAYRQACWCADAIYVDSHAGNLFIFVLSMILSWQSVWYEMVWALFVVKVYSVLVYFAYYIL